MYCCCFSGIGKKVWLKCMEVLGDRNIFLTGVAHMVPVYNRWGFKTPTKHGILMVKGPPTIPSDFQPSSSVEVQAITAENLDDIMVFDQTVSLTDRRNIMKVFFFSLHTRIAKCAIENGKVVGYILLRDSRNAIRSSSFYANSLDVAKSLLCAAIKDLEPGTTLDMGFSRANADLARPLYEMFGLGDIKEGDKGYCTKEDVNLPWHKVFGCLEFFSVFY